MVIDGKWSQLGGFKRGKLGEVDLVYCGLTRIPWGHKQNVYTVHGSPERSCMTSQPTLLTLLEKLKIWQEFLQHVSLSNYSVSLPIGSMRQLVYLPTNIYYHNQPFMLVNYSLTWIIHWTNKMYERCSYPYMDPKRMNYFLLLPVGCFVGVGHHPPVFSSWPAYLTLRGIKMPGVEWILGDIWLSQWLPSWELTHPWIERQGLHISSGKNKV